jgi:hypothetical protein
MICYSVLSWAAWGEPSQSSVHPGSTSPRPMYLELPPAFHRTPTPHTVGLVGQMDEEAKQKQPQQTQHPNPTTQNGL